MSETKHTPGPWVAKGGYTPTVMAGDVLLCVPSARADQIGGRSMSELDANARLIAAAPDLLAACREALADLYAADAACPGDAAQARVRQLLLAAVAKAEGRQS